MKRLILISLPITIISALAILYFKKEVIFKDHFDDKMIFAESNHLNTMFGDDLSEVDKRFIEEKARKAVSLIIFKPQFFKSIEVVEKWEKEIIRLAKDKNIPGEIALGMALLENGGSEMAVSYAGAAGIFQITKNTAEVLGLRVEDKPVGLNLSKPVGLEVIDERLDPKKNIEAGLRYLSNNLKLFPNIGVAVWSYHAGEQNVSEAVKAYLADIGEKDAFDLLEAQDLGKLDRAKEVWRAYLTKDGLNIHKLLQNQKVKKEVIENLGDETELYPYKVFASAVLYEAYKNYEEKVDFVEKIELFRQGRIVLSDLIDPNYNFRGTRSGVLFIKN